MLDVGCDYFVSKPITLNLKVFKSLAIRYGRKRATVAAGHRILKTIYVVLSKKVYCKDPEVNYKKLIVKSNAPRWFQSLRKFGYLEA